MKNLGLFVLSIPLFCCCSSAQQVQKPEDGLSATNLGESNKQEEHLPTNVPADVVITNGKDDSVNTFSDVLEQTGSSVGVTPDGVTPENVAPTSSVESDVSDVDLDILDDAIPGDSLAHFPETDSSDGVVESDDSEEEDSGEVNSSSQGDEFPDPVDLQTLDTANIEKVIIHHNYLFVAKGYWSTLCRHVVNS